AKVRLQKEQNGARDLKDLELLDADVAANKDALLTNSKYLRYRMNGYVEHKVYTTNLPMPQSSKFKSEEEYQLNLRKKRTGHVDNAILTLKTMTKTIGGGLILDRCNIYQSVVSPFIQLLNGTLKASDLEKLTGVPAGTRSSRATDKLIVMICDRVADK